METLTIDIHDIGAVVRFDYLGTEHTGQIKEANIKIAKEYIEVRYSIVSNTIGHLITLNETQIK